MSISDLKTRVIASLNKLSDRDTAALAAAELNSIAKTLTPATFSPFLSLLSSTNSSHKSPVRTQTVRLLSLLSSAHANSLSPHLPKLLAALLRRLKDSDSSVRNACVDALSSISSNITSPPFSAVANPLINALLHDQDYNVQLGAAMCLAAAIEAAPAVEAAEMRKLLPRLVKLVRSDCFKAKAAMLLLIGSVVGGGGAASGGVKNLTECLVEFLSSEDWAARKAAAEALWRLGVSERNGVVLGEVKGLCLVALEKCRFDKVKVARETMNKAFELWKEIAADGVSGPTTQSPKVCGSEIGSPPASKIPPEIGFKTPKPKKTISTSRSPPSDSSSTTTSQKSIPLKASSRKQRMNSVKVSNWKTEIDVPQAYLKVTGEDDLRITSHSGSASNEDFSESKQEIKRVLFNKNCDEKPKRVGGLRSRSRVVPLIENDESEINFAVDNASEDIYWNQEEVEDLSRIQKQLVQIENQQSSLLDLLQRFIGSSQNGMNSLQTRVNGLEMALDEMSQNLAVSSGSVSETDSAGNTCCMLPRSEFLRSKFRKRTEGMYSTSRVSLTGRNHSLDE